MAHEQVGPAAMTRIPEVAAGSWPATAMLPPAWTMSRRWSPPMRGVFAAIVERLPGRVIRLDAVDQRPGPG